MEQKQRGVKMQPAIIGGFEAGRRSLREDGQIMKVYLTTS